MGGMFSKPKIKTDKSALRAAEEQKKKSQEEARLADAKKQATEEANTQRKKNVTASGRAATVLAGDNASLLGQ